MPGSFLNNYFGFNKQQRNGLFVLIIISCILLIIRITYPVFIVPDTIELYDLPLIEKKPGSTNGKANVYSENKPEQTDDTAHLFVFNPNTVSVNQLKQLGLKEKTAGIFIKFRNNGFVFKQKSDLKKVYGVTNKLYARLEPYILIDIQPASRNVKKEEEQKTTQELHTKQTFKKIELNTADSLALVALNGIGPGYARRIIKYRNILGGFITIEQLKEVYGFSEELFENIKDNIYVEVQTIKKLNLNKDEFKLLNKHPYLTYEITKTIFDWRRKTTITAANLKDILNNNTLYEKLLPYLSFD